MVVESSDDRQPAVRDKLRGRRRDHRNLGGRRRQRRCMGSLDDLSVHWANDLRHRIDELIDEYRASLHDCLDGLSDEEARMSLVPSKTTLLGLVKHVTFVEGVWFDQAVTGRTYVAI